MTRRYQGDYRGTQRIPSSRHLKFPFVSLGSSYVLHVPCPLRLDVFAFSHPYAVASHFGWVVEKVSIFFCSWMDGSKVDFVAWATGEPNFANDDENCVTMYTNSGRPYTDLIKRAVGVMRASSCIFRLKIASSTLSKRKTETPKVIGVTVLFAKINGSGCSSAR